MPTWSSTALHNPPLLIDSGHYFLYKPYFSNLCTIEAMWNREIRRANFGPWFFVTLRRVPSHEPSFPGRMRCSGTIGARSMAAKTPSASRSNGPPRHETQLELDVRCLRPAVGRQNDPYKLVDLLSHQRASARLTKSSSGIPP